MRVPLLLLPLLCACLSKLGETGQPPQDSDTDTGTGIPAGLTVEITWPEAGGGTYHEGVPARLEARATDSTGRLEQLVLRALPDLPDPVLGQVSADDPTQAVLAINAPLPEGTTAVEAEASDTEGHLATDRVDDLRVLSCAGYDPVARWTFDEDEGGTVPDQSGYGTDGLARAGSGGTATLAHVAGVMGQAVDLTDGSTWIQGQLPDVPLDEDGFTLIVYVLFPQGGAEEPIFTLSGSRGRLSVELWTDSLSLGLATVGSRTSTGLHDALTDGDWHQLAAVLDPEGSLTLYVDASSAYTQRFSLGGLLSWGSDTFHLGADAAGTTRAAALFDDFTVLPGTLSVAELESAKQAWNAFCY